MIGYDWFTFFVVQLCGSSTMALLVSLFIFAFILLLGRVSYQMTIVCLLMVATYFSAILFSGLATVLIILLGELVTLIFEINKSLNREQ